MPEQKTQPDTASSQTPVNPLSLLRVGQGFDVHPWSDDPDRMLVLGGVAFPEATGLVGHSDADVIAHACTDAILGAAGLGDIGQLFPDTTAVHAGADSIELLSIAHGRVIEAGWTVLNIDATVILDAPKLAPHKPAMIERLSSAVAAPVSIKGKRTEGVAGLAGGIQCHATALLIGTDLANGIAALGESETPRNEQG